MRYVEIYTDGACSGNPGPGGWGAILKFGEHTKEISGYEKHTTNNRMEMMAVIMGIMALKEPCRVKVVTDSKYIVDSVNKGWLDSWIASNYAGRKNADLWDIIAKCMANHEIEFTWVKGHNGHYYNELSDKLATNAIKYRRG